jgi:hypothetical protein
MSGVVMQPQTGPGRVHHSIGELCVAGDWACAHGDLGTLASIAESLAARADEPLHCTLEALGESCRVAPERAVELWFRLRDTLQKSSWR